MYCMEQAKKKDEEALDRLVDANTDPLHNALVNRFRDSGVLAWTFSFPWQAELSHGTLAVKIKHGLLAK